MNFRVGCMEFLSEMPSPFPMSNLILLVLVLMLKTLAGFLSSDDEHLLSHHLLTIFPVGEKS